MTPEQRFWQYVNPILDDRGCWEWTGPRRGKGYGCFGVDRRKVQAHRFAYEMLVGDIPEGLNLDHLCRNLICVNPRHLEPVTNRENILRGINFIADQAKKTHCKNGHELSGDNLISWRGHRACKACHRAPFAPSTRADRAARKRLGVAPKTNQETENALCWCGNGEGHGMHQGGLGIYDHPFDSSPERLAKHKQQCFAARHVFSGKGKRCDH